MMIAISRALILEVTDALRWAERYHLALDTKRAARELRPTIVRTPLTDELARAREALEDVLAAQPPD
jgi:hypothetical protein